MSKNSYFPEQDKTSSNYELKSEAVETLASTTAENAPRFTEEELKRYKSKGGIKLPGWLKVVLIKTWFAGAVCFFFLWGLGIYIQSRLDQLFVTSIAMGMVTDLLLNNVLRFIEETPGENNRWILVRKRGVIGLFLNVMYGFLIVLGVYSIYNGINYVIMDVMGFKNTILGVEPILFGVFAMGIDMLFVFIRNLIFKKKD